MKKKVLVIGASTNPQRFAYLAIEKLHDYGYEIVALGRKTGEVNGIEIETEKLNYTDINTITIYIGSQNQDEYMDYLIGLQPKRVIFNPGTANPVFESQLVKNHIEVVHDCTLVMLDSGNF